MSNQTAEQRKTIAQLELGRTERIEMIFDRCLIKGDMVTQFYVEGEPLPFRSICRGWIGKGDSRREADAQLASKLSFAGK